jgi:Ca-activated chloride channel family protein
MPVRLEAILRIADGPAETTRPWSPDLRLSVQAIEGGAEVAPEKGMSLDRDLVIRWSACKQETGLRVVEGKGLPTDNGRYIMITLTPPSSQSRAILRDLTLLIDASGSMSGQPLEQAKTVAMELLHSLDHGDRFEILAFANEVRPLIAGPVQAGEKSVDRACKELRKLEASGATEMKEAIIKALKPLRPGSQRQVILLSDGYIGFEQEVIGEIWRGLVPGARVHAVGVGSAPNRTLTRGAARAGRGTEIVIGLEEDAKKAAQRLLQATVRPALTDLAVQGSALLSCAPKKPADVFAGRPVLIFAEVKPEGGHLRVSGKAAGESPSWALEIPPLISGSSQGISSTPVAIGALFGREAIEDAEIDLAARNGRSAELDEKIEALGLRHGISSRMTSLIAISENPTVDPRNPRRRERLPVEVPAGVSAEDAGVLPSARLFAMQSMVSGAPALRSRIIKILSRQDALIEKLEQMDMLLNENAMALPPPGLITIKHARALSIDGRNLVFEFEVPVDDFILPGAGTKIRVEFDDSEETGFAAVLENESSKPGPYAAGLTVRLALKLKGRKNDWNHNIGDLSWPGRLKAGRAKVNVNVRIHIQLKVKK